MKVNWTNHAIGQLIDIHDYILNDSKFYAKIVVDRITKSTKKLQVHPQIGRKVPELNQHNIREIIHGNYRIIYKLENEKIDILSVVHSAQQFSTYNIHENE